MDTGPDSSTAKRLIIHCGVQKTGSTSLQHFLGRNRDKLAGRLAILTPVKGSATRDLGNAAMRFSLRPSDKRMMRLRECAMLLRDAILRQDAGTVLLSHENLLGAMPGNGGTVSLYPQLEPIVDALERAFAPLRPDYAIYTRGMDAWKRSVHSQAICSDGYTGTLAEFLSETEACRDWSDVQRRLELAVGPTRARFFRVEDEPTPERPGQQLLHHAGLSATEIAALSPARGRRKVRMNTGSVEFQRLVNQLKLDRAARRAIRELIAGNQGLFAS